MNKHKEVRGMMRWWDKFMDWLLDRMLESKKAKTVWRVRDGYTYTDLFWDKAAYAWRYHQREIEMIVIVLSSIISTLIVWAVIKHIT